MIQKWLALHPKIKAAGVGAGLILIADGVCAIIGVPTPGWVTPVVSALVPIVFGYFKSA